MPYTDFCVNVIIMEFIRNRRWTLPVSILGGLALGAGLTLGVQSIEGGNKDQNYTQVYERTYTGTGDCMKNTPFDPTDGAFMNLNYDSKAHEEVLSVMPAAANSYRPSVLFFLAANNRLSPADHYTAGFLEQSHCQGLPNGS